MRRKWSDCPRCACRTFQLKTADGDPDGIRLDRQCPKCGRVYAVTKAGMYHDASLNVPRAIIVGEAPGPRQQEWRVFSGSCGDRLDWLVGRPWSEAMLGVNLLDYRQGLGRGGSNFPLREGRAAARMLVRSSPWFDGSKLVLLAGQRVAWSFGLGGTPYFERVRVQWVGPTGRDESAPAVVVPHPSGRCRWWNAPENRARARRWFKRTFSVS